MRSKIFLSVFFIVFYGIVGEVFAESSNFFIEYQLVKTLDKGDRTSTAIHGEE